jgi:hypothetical protein
MNFSPMSLGLRITLVTTACTHPVSSFLRRCDHDVEEKRHRVKLADPGGICIAWSGRRRGRKKNTVDRLASQPLHVPLHQQKGVFHRPGLPLAGVKCELVTEVRPSPRIHTRKGLLPHVETHESAYDSRPAR